MSRGQKILTTSEYGNAKPFLKWAGGKTQLIDSIKNHLPKELFISKSWTYVEPFVGSGAILFWMLNNFPNIKKAVINDVNSDLINTYQVIASTPKELIKILKDWETEYHNFKGDRIKQEECYYYKRDLYNRRSSEKIVQGALFIFLNRSCFNGLYRVNRKNQFNVPIGSYKAPTICDEENILSVNNALKKVEFLNGDFENTLSCAETNSFFYFDPPYKPLSQTSSFNSYAKDEFNDEEQIRLRNFCDKLDNKGINWMLSNSDVKGKNVENNFFDDIFCHYNINRVKAKRMINANASKRGELLELLITNYKNEQALSVA